VNQNDLRALLQAVADRRSGVDDAVARLRAMPFAELPFATVDHHRSVRCGHPEVIFCPGKRPEHIVEIARRLSADDGRVLATRATVEQVAAVRTAFPNAEVNEVARAVMINPPPPKEPGRGSVGVVCAGTSDLPVAEEALVTLRSMNVPAHRVCDVGVSGLHRLLAKVPVLQQCCAIVCVAGMEGALPSVVAGLVGCPVFAVPTGVGYGANLGGLAALLTMVNSCAANVSVVNIDNGFGAAFSAGLVYQQVQRSTAEAQRGGEDREDAM
jgi:pyridinium-3,5-biscarboxylic acid mononucleotide synthase